MNLNSKQRAYLKSIASSELAILNVGRSGVTPEVIASVNEALTARELIKIGVLKNCMEDTASVASMISERTHSMIVHIIGKKIVLYKPSKDKDKVKIKLPL